MKVTTPLERENLTDRILFNVVTKENMQKLLLLFFKIHSNCLETEQQFEIITVTIIYLFIHSVLKRNKMNVQCSVLYFVSIHE